MLSAKERIEIKKAFTRCLKAIDISCITKETIGQLSDSSGCYFWTMRSEGEEHKIYIGRTRSLQNRVKDYSKGFQLHSPNDYKIQFFQEFISQNYCSVGLDLYFKQCSVKENPKQEAKLVRKFRPLINDRMATSLEEKIKVQDVYRQYYFNYWRNLKSDA
jgi:hypothetical protein